MNIKDFDKIFKNQDIPHRPNDEYIENCKWPEINKCPNDECMVCGMLDCPDNEPLHYHHDGCPRCYQLDNLESDK